MPSAAQARGYTAQVTSLPAPVGGLNLVDSLANMPETDALVLENYIARGNSVELRRGYTQHATGLVSDVKALMPYNTAAGAKLFAAAGTSFFDVTTAGPVGAAVQTGLTNSIWEHVNVATAAGQFLYAFNGVDSPRIWNGTIWQTVTGVSAPIAITGVTTSTLAAGLLHQNRLWFLQKDTLVTWYLGVNSVGGAATAFDLRTVAKLGGSVIAFDTWTMDSGTGTDDNLVFITSEGEVIVYAGTDPANFGTWSLRGIFRTGRPAGRRCTTKIRGDLLILSEGGVIALSQLMQSGTERQSYITYKIQPELQTFLTSGLGNFGFQILYFQQESLGILNVPESATITRQYVFDVTTQAWSKWTSLFSLCYAMFGGTPFFGQTGVASKLWTADSDNTLAIRGEIKPAFSKFGYPLRKNQRRIRIYFSAQSPISFGLKINRDFENLAPTNISLSTQVGGTSLWGTALWGTAVWGGVVAGGTSEVAVAKIGTYLTPYIITQTKDLAVKLNGFDHVFENGGFT
ncbi:MAG: hypothetical protein ACRDIC_19660 [bacterium]